MTSVAFARAMRTTFPIVSVIQDKSQTKQTQHANQAKARSSRSIVMWRASGRCRATEACRVSRSAARNGRPKPELSLRWVAEATTTRLRWPSRGWQSSRRNCPTGEGHGVARITLSSAPVDLSTRPPPPGIDRLRSTGRVGEGFLPPAGHSTLYRRTQLNRYPVNPGRFRCFGSPFAAAEITPCRPVCSPSGTIGPKISVRIAGPTLRLEP